MLENYLNTQIPKIEDALSQLVPQHEGRHQQLFEAARYSLLNGGKRLRPILVLATTEALGGHTTHALNPACALEMVHTYSMIHDDLPCMDDDDFRRGKPTLHKVFPESHAVLAGDFLLTYAFETLAQAPYLSAEQRLQLIATLAKSSGGTGMIAGQIMDLEAENQEIDLETLQQIHLHKTGALITASVMFGGIIGHASEEQLQILTRFGQQIGLAFQIVDDILDITNSEQKHGKATASDVINGKATYTALMGLEKAKQTANTIFQDALQLLSLLPTNTTLLAQLAERIVRRTN